MIIVGDEGIILKRLFNIFAFRPILVQTMPIYNNQIINPYNSSLITTTITTIPFITFRIIKNVFNSPDNDLTLEITRDYLETIKDVQPIMYINDLEKYKNFYIIDNQVVEKKTIIQNVKGPLIYYIPRRTAGLPNILTPQYRENLPMMENIELIDSKVFFTNTMYIGEEQLYLHSLVTLKTTNDPKKIMCTGSYAIILNEEINENLADTLENQ